jgi:RNA polymerase sigma factor (sigma-70 family)
MRRILAESPGRLRDDRLPRIVGDRDPAKDAAVDVALRKLEAFDPRKSEVVMLRFYLGMTVKEVADTLGLSPRTIDDDWCIARAWLRREIESGGGS